MTNKKRSYDHLVLCVNDLDTARKFYTRLGFTMTPGAAHPFGTHNCLVQLQGNFLEVLAVNDAALIMEHKTRSFSFPAFNRDYLEAFEGFSMVVYQGSDAAGDAAEFAARGLSDFEPFDFSRKAKLPDGDEVTVSFSLAFVTHDDMPKATFFTCHQHNPEYFWKPEYQRHDNTATAIIETMMVADEPEKYTEFFNQLLNSDATTSAENGGLNFTTTGGSFSLLTPVQWRTRFPGEAPPDLSKGPRLAGYTIKVDSIDKATQHLTQNTLTHAISKRGVFISAQTAHGCVIEFTQHT